jgi:C4-dicarboxylate-binding protein DctP
MASRSISKVTDMEDEMRKAKALVIMAVFFLAVATSLSAAPIVIKLGHVEPENRSTHKATVEFKNYVEAQSGGRLSVEIFPNGQLGGDRQMTEAVALGVLQMTIPATSVLTTYNAKFGVLDLPFVFNDEKAAFAALDGDLGNTLNALLLPVGLRNLGYGYNGARHMSNNLRPITQPADLKGIKMRVMESPTFIDLFRLLGANPTPMAFGEVFTGLQQKTVDAQENSASLVFTMKFNEVQKFYSLTGHVQGILAYIINDRFYKGLSADLQKIVADGTRMFLVEKQRQYEVADTSVFLKRLADGGMTINEITPANHQKFVDLLQPMYAKFARANGQDILDLIAKYNK